MLTRLKVSGFKNLIDVDIRFGTFTCIAGANGVGKSNLFDAIKFLSTLASRPLLEAALSIRGKSTHIADVRHLFHSLDSIISYEADMIIPSTGLDDLGQEAKTTSTFLRYRLVLKYKKSGNIEIFEEELLPIPKKEIDEQILFTQSLEWNQSVFLGGQRKQRFISTQAKENKRFIKLHGEGKSRLSYQSANNLPATVLSSVTRAEHPTTLLAKREMQSWRLLQLEPSVLRQSDEFSLAPASLGSDGSHLAKTLYTLALNETTEQQIYGQLANRLAELIEDVQTLKVVHDNQRDLLTVEVAGHDGIFHPAKFLSDGTLRFLALAVLEQSAESGLWCIEEPENGIHPRRIEATLRLLEDIAMDTAYPLNSDNPFRQIIINTHSPSVVASVRDDSLVVAELKDTIHSGQHFKRAHFACLANTWRSTAQVSQMTKARLLDYFNPIVRDKYVENQKQRVKNRSDLQMMLP